MAESSLPFTADAGGDDGPYSADEWRELWRRILNGRPNQTGVIPGSGAVSEVPLRVQATSPASASIEVLAGAALVFGAYYQSTVTETRAITANVSGNPRIDTFILRLDYVGQDVRLEVLEGTPAGAPVPPTLTQALGVTWEIPLADIAVANGFVTIAEGDVTLRAEIAAVAMMVYLDDMENNSGATVESGAPVILDASNDRSFNTTAVERDAGLLGVLQGRVLAAGIGRIIARGIALVETDGAVTRGDILATSTTVGLATNVTGNAGVLLGRALETTIGAGSVLAYIDVQHNEDYIHVKDEKVSATNGGTFTAGAWQTRDLNVLVADTGSHATLAANQITLQSGTYRFLGIAPAQEVADHQCRLQNITDGTTIEDGKNAKSSTGDSTSSDSIVSGRFTITSAKVLELQHQSTSTQAANGFGNAVGLTLEVYSIIEFWREN